MRDDRYFFFIKFEINLKGYHHGIRIHRQGGIKHNLNIYQSHQEEKLIFTIHRKGNLFIELERDENRWIEVFCGPSERSTEYGAVLDYFFVFTDRSFTPKKAIDRGPK